MSQPVSLDWTGNPEADRLLADNPTALLIGMLLDQQFPMERAFAGPWLLQERMGTPIDAQVIIEQDPDQLAAMYQGPPAIHRYWGSMAQRTQQLCQFLVDNYEGDPTRIWSEATDAKDLLERLNALPGYGKAKSRIFVGVLAKRFGIELEGWEDVAADWASIADVASFDDVATLREEKRRMKEASKKQ